MRYPVNPVMIAHPPAVKTIPKLHEFCKQRSIPFSDNEDRFYKVVKHRYLQTAYKSAVNALEKVFGNCNIMPKI